MMGGWSLWFWLGLVGFSLSGSTGEGTPDHGEIPPVPDGTCVACHREMMEVYRRSSHTRAGVTCTSCHGGHAGTLDSLQAHRRMRALTNPREGLRVCVDCHTRPDRMAVYGLRLDVERYWRASAHGRLWRRDPQKAPGCIRCHTAHRIVPVRDPESPVSPARQVEGCGSCHEENLQAFLQSAHYRALEEQRTRAPSCATCHQNHGTLALDGVAQRVICGECHVGEAQLLSEGVHGSLKAMRDMKGCRGCHEGHEEKIQDTGIALCQRCHTEDEERVWVLATAWEEPLRHEMAAWKEIQKHIEEGKIRGLNVYRLEAWAQNADVLLAAIRNQVHSLEEESVERAVARSEALRHDVEEALEEVHEHRMEEGLFLGVLWFFIASTVAVLGWRWYQMERGDGGSGA